MILFLYMLIQSTTYISGFHASSCSTRHSTFYLSAYNRDYNDQYYPSPEADSWSDKYYEQRGGSIENEYFDHPGDRLQNRDSYNDNSQPQYRGKSNTYHERVNNARRMQGEQQVGRRFGNTRRPRQPFSDYATRNQRRGLDSTRPTSARYGPNTRQRQRYDDPLRRDQRQRRSMDPIQRNTNDPSLRNGSDKNFYMNNISSRRRTSNTNTRTNNFPRRSPRNVVRNKDSRHGEETRIDDIPYDNSYNKPSDNVQNGRHSRGMVAQGYVDNVKSQKYGQSSVGHSNRQQSSDYYQHQSDSYNTSGNNYGKPSDSTQNGRQSRGMVAQGYVDNIKSQKYGGNSSGGYGQQSNGNNYGSDNYNVC